MRLRCFPIAAIVLTAVAMAGCGHKAENYFPLEKGRYWEYQMKVSILGHDAIQKQVYRNQGTGELDGKSVLIREYPGGGHGYFRVTGEGVERVASAGLMSDDLKPDPAGQFVLKMPVADREPHLRAHRSHHSPAYPGAYDLCDRSR